MDDSGAAVGVREGDVLAGKYRIDGLLGVGGTGVVLAAHHLQLDQRVALKFLAPESLKNPEATIRFAREARAAGKIANEHVAQVRDVCTLENGTPYIVMEFLEGRDLSVWLREEGPLPVAQAVEFVLQACEAIAEAHSLGIIHRDLKPANLFVVRRSDGLYSVKVLDFGISKMPHGADFERTSTRIIMGSPHYMSPEQMRSSADVTPQSDIWSLGAILFELVAGESPFLGETFSEICLKAAMEHAPRLRSVRPDAPAGLEAIVAKCLEKDPARRFRDVAELAAALQPFAPLRTRASLVRIVSTRTTAPCERPVTTPKTGGRSVTVAGAVLALLAGFALAIAQPGGRRALHMASPTSTRGQAAAPPAQAPPEAELYLPPLATPTPTATPPPTSAPAPAPAEADDADRAPRPGHDVAATSRRRAPQADCNPPFYFDANGIRVFKKECVR
jgi:serine/threonine-protein kinase